MTSATPGACHLYIHTTELTTQPERAEPCAEYLGNSIPGASHINHMPSHTWTRVGRWGDAVRASLQAWQSDQKAAEGEGFATYPAHDLQMLAFAASMDGQGALAIQAGRGLTTLTKDPMYHALTLVRFGRFDEISGHRRTSQRMTSQVASGTLPRGMRSFAVATPRARGAHLDRVLTVAASSKAVFKIHPAKTLLGTLGGILEGEIHRAAGDLPAALAAFERAVSLEDLLIVDDPQPLPFAARHWLGAALLDAKRFADAERVYREDLGQSPAQRVVTPGPSTGAEGPGQIIGGGRHRSAQQLGARRYGHSRVEVLGMRRPTPSRRRMLRTLAATGAATLVDPGPVLARLVAQQPCADPATAGTLLGTLPLFRAGAPVQPFGVKFGGAGLDARLVTDLSLLEPDRLITPNALAYIRTECPPRGSRASGSMDHQDLRDH